MKFTFDEIDSILALEQCEPFRHVTAGGDLLCKYTPQVFREWEHRGVFVNPMNGTVTLWPCGMPDAYADALHILDRVCDFCDLIEYEFSRSDGHLPNWGIRTEFDVRDQATMPRVGFEAVKTLVNARRILTLPSDVPKPRDAHSEACAAVERELFGNDYTADTYRGSQR